MGQLVALGLESFPVLACLTSKQNADCVRDWLGAHILPWVDMAIVNHAKYLGILLGPTAGNGQWRVALKKFRDRVSEINEKSLPLPIDAIHLQGGPSSRVYCSGGESSSLYQDIKPGCLY